MHVPLCRRCPGCPSGNFEEARRWRASNGRVLCATEQRPYPIVTLMPQAHVKDILKAATGAHGTFKTRLFDAIAHGNLAEFAEARAGRDDLCVFGRWLHEEILPSLKLSSHYPAVKWTPSFGPSVRRVKVEPAPV